MKLGLGLSLCNVRGAGFTPPAEWGGLTPAIDWDMANAVLSGSNITSVPNAPTLDASKVLTGVASNLPTYVASSANFNSKPAASFTGTLRFSFGDLGIAAGGPDMFIAVGKVMTDGGNAGQILWRLTNNHFAMYGEMLTTNCWRGYNSNGGGPLANPVTATTASIIGSSLASGTQKFYANSTTPRDTFSSTTPDYSGGGGVGNNPSAPAAGASLQGEVARLLVFSVVPSAGQLTTIFNALASKYGITLS